MKYSTKTILSIFISLLIVLLISTFAVASLTNSNDAEENPPRETEPATTSSDQYSDNSSEADAATATSALCGGTSFSEHLAAPDTLEGLIWMSDQVVWGTIVEELPPNWSGEMMEGSENEPQFDGQPIRTIYTDYLVKVDYRLRGQDTEYVRLRREGGSIADCEIASDSTPFRVGDEALFFLRLTGNEDDRQDEMPPMFLTHPGVGMWATTTEDKLAPWKDMEYIEKDATDKATIEFQEKYHLEWDQIRERGVRTLESGEYPDDWVMPSWAKSLDQAPLQDQSYSE